MVDLNGTAAAKRAGYSEDTSRQQAVELLNIPLLRKEIAKGMNQRTKRTRVTADRVIRELALIAFSDIGDILDFTNGHVRLRNARDIPKRARRAISSMKVKRYMEGHGEDAVEVEVTEFKLWSKESGLEKLAKHLNLLGDKADEGGGDTAMIVRYLQDFFARRLPLHLRTQIFECLKNESQCQLPPPS